MRIFIKWVLSKLGILDLARLVNDELLHKKFITLDVDFNGIRFPITVPAGDYADSIQAYGAYEPLLMERIMEVAEDGMKVLDVGAAEGYFTVFVTNLPNVNVSVTAFDADASRLRLFKRNISRSEKVSVKLIQSYVGDGQRVENPALDTLARLHGLEHIGMIKLDVEGEEIFVLPGATQLIERDRPHVFAEIHPPEIASIDKDGITKLLSWLEEIDMPIWLCTNHRGQHRGPVEPWRKVSVVELGQFITSGGWEAVGNFYIHLDPRSL